MLKRFIRTVTLASLISIAFAHTQAQSNLYQYINQLQSMQADFTQTLSDPSSGLNQQSNGKMWIQKPHDFKWQTLSPSQQLMVSNGEKLWIYDEELMQVTVQDVPKDMAQAPYLVLLTGDPSTLDDLFEVSEPHPNHFVLAPKGETGAMIRSIDMYFVNDHLQKLAINTVTGQVTEISFNNAQFDKIPASIFDFTPPKDADVLEM